MWQKLDFGIFWPEVLKTRIVPYMHYTIMLDFLIDGHINFVYCWTIYVGLTQAQPNY